MKRRQALAGLQALAAAATMPASISAWAAGNADGFPGKPVRIVTFFGPGSGPDTVTRVIADVLGKKWGQAVIVDNRPGVNGILSLQAVASAAPDGYTLGVSDSSVLAINPFLYPSMKIKPETDLTPLLLWMNVPFYLLVPANGPVQSVKELIAYAKANPGKISYGSPTGVGNPSHLGMEFFKQATGTDMVLVPYKTSPPMLTDLAAGTLQVAWASEGSAHAMLQLGNIKPIAVASKARQPVHPEVPTLLEAGGPDLEVNAWMGMIGPKGMPSDLVDKINADIDAVLSTPEVRQRIVDLGNEPIHGTGKDMSVLLKRDLGRYGPLIKKLDLHLE